MYFYTKSVQCVPLQKPTFVEAKPWRCYENTVIYNQNKSYCALVTMASEVLYWLRTNALEIPLQKGRWARTLYVVLF